MAHASRTIPRYETARLGSHPQGEERSWLRSRATSAEQALLDDQRENKQLLVDDAGSEAVDELWAQCGQLHRRQCQYQHGVGSHALVLIYIDLAIVFFAINLVIVSQCRC